MAKQVSSSATVVSLTVHLVGDLAGAGVTASTVQGDVTVALGSVVLRLSDRAAAATMADGWATGLAQARAVALPTRLPVGAVSASAVVGALAHLRGPQAPVVHVVRGSRPELRAVSLQTNGLTVVAHDLAALDRVTVIWRQAVTLARALWDAPDDNGLS